MKLKIWDINLPSKVVYHFSLGDIIIPEEKATMIAEANQEVDGIV